MITCSPISMSWRSRAGFVLELRMTHLLVLALIFGAGLSAMSMAAVITDAPLDNENIASQAALFCLLYQISILVHELGHGLAGRAVGLGWTKLALGWRVYVHIRPQATYAQQVVISFTGPFLHALCGVLMILLGQGSLTVLISGVVITLEGVLNLLLPVHRNTDATKLYRSIWHTLRGRGTLRHEPT